MRGVFSEAERADCALRLDVEDSLRNEFLPAQSASLCSSDCCAWDASEKAESAEGLVSFAKWREAAWTQWASALAFLEIHEVVRSLRVSRSVASFSTSASQPLIQLWRATPSLTAFCVSSVQSLQRRCESRSRAG